MSWNQEEMNYVYLKVQKTAMTDEVFRKELIADPKAAIEKLSGKELPQGFKIKVVESDPAYAATFVLPDFIGEAIDDEDLDNVAGGAVSFLAIVSVCGAAFSPGCGGDVCGAKLGGGTCGGDICGAKKG